MLKRLWLDEGGAILSAELLLLMVILVIGLSVGMVALRDAIVSQYGELALAIAGVDTSFGWSGLYYECAIAGGFGDGDGSFAWAADSYRLATYNVDGYLTLSDMLITGVAPTEEKADTTPF